MTRIEIRVTVVDDGVATVEWEPLTADADLDDEALGDALAQALATAADDALLGHELRRLEVSVAADDRFGRRAALRAGFRHEGTRRQAWGRADGTYVDVQHFGRLARDQVYGPGGFSGVMNSTLPRKRVIAHVVIRDHRGRVLLCETRFKPDWELPGGIVEPFEPPRTGAERELVEELGLTRTLGPLLVADWMPPYLGWDDALELLFEGGRLEEDSLATLVLQPSEIVQVRLCTLDEARALLTPLAHRRLTVALGLAPGAFAYLEDGFVP